MCAGSAFYNILQMKVSHLRLWSLKNYSYSTSSMHNSYSLACACDYFIVELQQTVTRLKTWIPKKDKTFFSKMMRDCKEFNLSEYTHSTVYIIIMIFNLYNFIYNNQITVVSILLSTAQAFCSFWPSQVCGCSPNWTMDVSKFIQW